MFSNNKNVTIRLKILIEAKRNSLRIDERGKVNISFKVE